MGPLFQSIYRVLAMLGLTNYQAKWNAFVTSINTLLAANSVDGSLIRRYTAFDLTTGIGTMVLTSTYAIQGRSKTTDFSAPLQTYEIFPPVGSVRQFGNGTAIQIQYPYFGMSGFTGTTLPEQVFGMSYSGGAWVRPALTTLGIPTGVESRAVAGVYNLGVFNETPFFKVGEGVFSNLNGAGTPWGPGGSFAVTGCMLTFDSVGGPASLGLSHHIKITKTAHGVGTGSIVRLSVAPGDLISQLPDTTSLATNRFLVLVDTVNTLYLVPLTANSVPITTFSGSLTVTLGIVWGASGMDGFGNMMTSVMPWSRMKTTHAMNTSGALKFDARGTSATTETPNVLCALGSDGPAGRGRHDWDGYGYRRLGPGANATAIALGATNPTTPIVAAYDAVTLTSHYIRAYRTIRISSTAALTGWTGNVLPPSYDGHEVTLYNAGSFSIVLPHGTGYNLRLIGGANQTLAALASVRLMFDATVGNWIQIGAVVTPV